MNRAHFQPPFVTEEMASLAVQCSGCNRLCRPDFWHKHETPFEIIRSTHPNSKGGGWRQVSTGIQCTCGTWNNLPIETKDLKNKVFFFGDEAYRDIGRNFVCVYSMIGATDSIVHDVGQKLAELKTQVAPDLAPNSWSIHATKLTSGHQRLKHPVYKRFNRETAETIVNTCIELIKFTSFGGWNRCITSVYRLGDHLAKYRPSTRKHLLRGIYIGLLGDAIHYSTKREHLPIFTFDSQTSSAPIRGVEGWADAAYFGSRHYLGHLFITHSNDVPAPRFVAPGSHPLLELADVHAFHVARHIAQRIQKVSPACRLEQFGRFRYICFRGNRMEWTLADTLPESSIFWQCI